MLALSTPFLRASTRSIHLRDIFSTRIADEEQLDTSNGNGRSFVISVERRITRNDAEYIAFRDSRLIGFFLSRGLYKAKVVKQMERILAMWENVSTLVNTVEGGAMFELPINDSMARALRLRSCASTIFVRATT